MGRNVEIKARLAAPERVRERVLALADSGPDVLEQADTFFVTEHGRLKLREFPNGHGELIYYERPDCSEPRESQCRIYSAPDSNTLHKVLADAMEVRGVVRKRRELFMVGQTRIHLDDVEGLGAYLELEVVLTEGQSWEEGGEIAKSLLQNIEIPPEAMVDRAYIDLLDARA